MELFRSGARAKINCSELTCSVLAAAVMVVVVGTVRNNVRAAANRARGLDNGDAVVLTGVTSSSGELTNPNVSAGLDPGVEITGEVELRGVAAAGGVLWGVVGGVDDGEELREGARGGSTVDVRRYTLPARVAPRGLSSRTESPS